MLRDKNENPIPVLAFGLPQTVNGSVSTAQSSVIDDAEHSIVRLAALSDLWVNISADPASVVDSCYYLPSGSIEYVTIEPGYKISVLGGKLNITKCY